MAKMLEACYVKRIMKFVGGCREQLINEIPEACVKRQIGLQQY